MKDKNLLAMCLGVLLGVLSVMLVACILATILTIHGATKAQRYDLDCLTEYNREPLKECKEE